MSNRASSEFNPNSTARSMSSIASSNRSTDFRLIEAKSVMEPIVGLVVQEHAKILAVHVMKAIFSIIRYAIIYHVFGYQILSVLITTEMIVKLFTDAISKSFASAVKKQVMTFIQQDKMSLAGIVFSYALVLYIIFQLIIAIPSFMLADKITTLFSAQMIAVSFLFKINVISSCVTSGLTQFFLQIMEAEYHMFDCVQLVAIKEIVHIVCLIFGFFLYSSTVLKQDLQVGYSVIIASQLVGQISSLIYPIIKYLHLFNETFEFKNLIYFNMKLIFPIKWKIISFVFKDTAVNVIKYGVEPAMQLFAQYVFLQEARSDPTLDYISRISYGIYQILAELSNVFNNAAYDILLQLFKFNLSMSRNHRILQVLQDAMLRIVLATFVLAVVMMIFAPSITKLLIYKKEGDTYYQLFINLCDCFRMASLRGLSQTPYYFASALMEVQNDYKLWFIIYPFMCCVAAAVLGVERATKEPSQLIYQVIVYDICLGIVGVGLWWVERKRFNSKKSHNTVLDELLNADNDKKMNLNSNRGNDSESVERDSNGDLVVGDIMAMALGGGYDDEEVVHEENDDLLAGLIPNDQPTTEGDPSSNQIQFAAQVVQLNANGGSILGNTNENSTFQAMQGSNDQALLIKDGKDSSNSNMHNEDLLYLGESKKDLHDQAEVIAGADEPQDQLPDE